jgi:hypothetical protein
VLYCMNSCGWGTGITRCWIVHGCMEKLGCWDYCRMDMLRQGRMVTDKYYPYLFWVGVEPYYLKLTFYAYLIYTFIIII